MLLTSRRRMKCVFCAFAYSERLVTPKYKYGFILNRSHGRPPSTVHSFGSAQPNGLRREFKTRQIGSTSKNDRVSRRPGTTQYDVNKIRDRLDNHDFRNLTPSPNRSLDVRRSPDRDMTFGNLLYEQVRYLGYRLRAVDTERIAWGIESGDDLRKNLESFQKQIRKCVQKAGTGSISRENNPLFFRLRHAFLNGSTNSLALELKYALLDSVVTNRLPRIDLTSQKRLADLRHPVEWYPATRALHRTIHLHVGPTNSGKTYHALKKLEAAQSGIYAGPLRLLAHEIYTRLNAMGKKCALVTGEERRIPEGMLHQMSSCTVEMVPLNTTVDVAVIDEIQMMGDWERGWAWTQAFLGVKAREVHLCGEVRTVELITELCRMLGDKLIVHRYERLSPLETQLNSLNHDLTNLKKGDAVILFSRVAIHAMKAAIEAKTKRRCAVVYGSLPPETRAQQAALFNDPDNDYDYLVASDAVGMGLNLSIKRIIFESVAKHNGTGYQQIPVSEIKQIAGRAGRYKTARDAIVAGNNGEYSPVELDIVKKPDEPTRGFVTTLDKFDLPVVREAMITDVKPMKTAGIFPPSDTLIRFASYFPPDTPFSYIVIRLHDLAIHEPIFQMCRLKDQVEVADLIQPYKLTVQDRITFMAAPVALREHGFEAVMKEFAECVANQDGGELLNLKTLKIELLAQEIHNHRLGSKGYLKEAEFLHKALTLYLWLSYRFSGIFRSQALAFHVKSLTEEKIDQCLEEVEWDSETALKLNTARRLSALSAAAQKERTAGELYDNSTGSASEELADLDSRSLGEGEEAREAVETEDSPWSDASIPAPFDVEDSGEEREVEEKTPDEVIQGVDSAPNLREDAGIEIESEIEALYQPEGAQESNEERELEEGSASEASQDVNSCEDLKEDLERETDSVLDILSQSKTTEDSSKSKELEGGGNEASEVVDPSEDSIPGLPRAHFARTRAKRDVRQIESV